MADRRSLAAPLIAALLLCSGAQAQEELSDPYQILKRHYEAIGGLDGLRAEKAFCFEAALSLDGLKGTVKHWETRPYKTRTEVDLKVMSRTTGDNGSVVWEVDSNGRLGIERDEDVLARRDVAARLAEYEHLDPASETFTLTFKGIEAVEGSDCYMIELTNTLERTATTWYIDTTSFLMRKSVNRQPDRSQITLFSDFREVGGLLRAFRQDEEIYPPGQKQSVTILEFRADPEVDPAIFEPPSERPRDFVFTAGGDAAEAPCQFLGNHIFLTVTVACSERLWVLDTGASLSVIDTEYAAKLGLQTEGSLMAEGSGSAVELTFVRLPPFRVPGIEFEEQKIAAISISPLFERTYGFEVAGILGYDFLSRFVTRVDYANEMLTFHDPGRFQYQGDGVILDAPLRDNILTVPATVDGDHTGRWMLDLGAGGVSCIPSFAVEHGLLDRKAVDRVGFGAGGRMYDRTSRYETISLAGCIVRDPLISAPAGSGESTAGIYEICGTLGNSVLRHFILYLDYDRQKIVVEKGRDFERVFPEDGSGLQIWRPDGDAYEVLFVSPGTPAGDAGFREGDVLRSINGIDADHLGGLLAIRKILSQAAGTKYRVAVLRDGERKEMDLTLGDLF